MAKLAIKGHKTRGKEIIEILKMMGGKNNNNCCGKFINRIYFIGVDRYIELCYEGVPENIFISFTLEEFLEKYPYKVGDWVQHKGATSYDSVYEIEEMQWDNKSNRVKYIAKNLRCIDCGRKFTLIAEHLQPYKKETKTMEEVYAYNEINCYHQDFCDKVKIRLGNDYEIKVEDNITYIVKKQPKYPRSYEECCKVLCCKPDIDFAGLDNDEENLYGNFIALKRCRDAYWKIAGEQMGLGKPWEPSSIEMSHVIVCRDDDTFLLHKKTRSILIFPTEEMRNTFFENFKDLIEECKELL